MLKIRKEQIKIFEAVALDRFENEMVEHSKIFSPILCSILGDDQLRIALRQAITKANKYGFMLKGTVRLYIEMTFLYGSGFDTDPQYSRFNHILNETENEMLRSEKLFAQVVNYQKKVAGPDNSYVRKALETIYVIAQHSLNIRDHQFNQDMLSNLTEFFPQKAAYTHESSLNAIIDSGQHVAKEHHFFSVREQAMMVILMFAFGHHCWQDPLYPWISKTLSDEKIKDAKARSLRLEKKALTWLSAVLKTVRR